MAQNEEALQDAANCVESLAKDRGLRCDSKKSEILSVYNSRYKGPGDLNVILEGQKIKEVFLFRILGLWIQSNPKANYTIQMLKKTTQPITRIIGRIKRNKTGMTEEDTLCLVQAQVVSRVV